MPSGELFRIAWLDHQANESASAVTSSYMADIKITKNNPLDTYPFSNIYKTTSKHIKNIDQDAIKKIEDYTKFEKFI